MHTKPFSAQLQKKIDHCKESISPISLGSLKFSSPALLAPMAGICTPPFRLLMQELGAGATVSELISCHGINHGNQKTLDMLKILEAEKNIGIQLFGEDAESMASAAKVVLKSNPTFIDINMGCPVRKVVTKGGGSALLKDIDELAIFFSTIKKVIDVPLTIKIRTGWDETSLNAEKIEKIALNEGIEWVAIHGRTREQQYKGHANWEYIENLAQSATLPIIGNGDLHQPFQVRDRMAETHCQALMIARGCLRNPFIFLESFADNLGPESIFKGADYWEAIERLYQFTCDTFDNERTRLVQLRKLIVWFAAGFPHAAKFRNTMFTCQNLDESMKFAQEFYLALGQASKSINFKEAFMTSGHG